MSVDNNTFDLSKVPEDFPRAGRSGAVPGAQTKMLVTEYKGKFYETGSTPPEIYERWVICEDLGQQFAQSCIRTKQGKRADMSEEDILAQYYRRLVSTEWVTPLEGRWVMRRAAALIEWPLPECLRN